jgi:nucleotidyltransferase/DNA polymerase involved in DNA repair
MSPVARPPTSWPRAIALMDMNAFFASIEQRDHAEWRGRPVAITNGLQGSCIITCSYEARARLLNRSSMPNVIAPAWKPFGHRQTL